MTPATSGDERSAAAQAMPGSGRALILAALLGGVMLPIVIFEIPVLADYPNHLARLYAIASLGHDKLLARYYEVDWRLVPNLAVDAIVPVLAKAVGIFVAGKLFVLATVVLLPTGTLALHRALYRRAALWPMTVFLFVYNAIFLYGFLNYIFATALALWATAIWIRQRDAGPTRRGAISSLFVLALFFSHFLGVVIYGMAIGSYELCRWYKVRPAGRELARDAAALILPFLLIIPLTLGSPTLGFAHETRWNLWPAKARGIFDVFKTYDRPSAVALAAIVAAAGSWGIVTGRLRLHPAGRLFGAMAAVVYLAMPNILMSAANADIRLPATFVLFLIGMSNWEFPSPGEARRFAAALAILVGAVVIEVSASWAHFTHAITRMERSFASIPPGSRVLMAANLAGMKRTNYTISLHFPALVMIERSAFYSHAFTHPAQQPLQVKPPYRASTPPDGEPLLIDDLAAADKDATAIHPLSTKSTGEPQDIYWSHWRQDYDYLYVLFTSGDHRPPLAALDPVDRGDDFALYKIGKLSISTP